jgi:hypothetical protein
VLILEGSRILRRCLGLEEYRSALLLDTVVLIEGQDMLGGADRREEGGGRRREVGMGTSDLRGSENDYANLNVKI